MKNEFWQNCIYVFTLLTIKSYFLPNCIDRLVLAINTDSVLCDAGTELYNLDECQSSKGQLSRKFYFLLVTSLAVIVVCSYITVLQLIFLCLFPYVFLSLRAYLFPCSATSRFRFIFPLLFLHLYTDFLFCFFFFISLPPVLRACDLFSARWTGRSAQVTNTTQHWYGAACSVVCTVWFSCRYRATYRLYSKCMLLQPFSE